MPEPAPVMTATLLVKFFIGIAPVFMTLFCLKLMVLLQVAFCLTDPTTVVEVAVGNVGNLLTTESGSKNAISLVIPLAISHIGIT